MLRRTIVQFARMAGWLYFVDGELIERCLNHEALYSESPRWSTTNAMNLRTIAARMIVDVVVIAISFALALLLWCFLNIAIQSNDFGGNGWSVVAQYFRMFYWHALLLVLVSPVVYAFNGFYTFGRDYRGRYKSLVIMNAVIYSYLCYAFMVFCFPTILDNPALPRGVFLLALGITLMISVPLGVWPRKLEKTIHYESEVNVLKLHGADRNVLVIGGGGYIGSALLPKLLDAGYRVRVLDLFLFGIDPINQIKDHPQLELVEGDFRHIDKIVQVMKRMDSVVHLGAIVGDPACDIDHSLTVDVNLNATQMIAQVAKASGTRRFVFASTCSVYGASDKIVDERSEVKPISLYGHTKLAAERGLKSMADDNFSPTILRFGVLYGLSGRTRFDLIVNLLTAQAIIRGQIAIHGGDQCRPFSHVDDAALAIFRTIESPLANVANQTFNVGSDDQNYTIEQIGMMIHEQVFTAELLLEKEGVDKRNYRVSFSKIRNMLGFEPQWSVEQGIRQVIRAIQTGDILDYLDPKFSNVKFFRESGAIEIIRASEDWAHELTEVKSRWPIATTSN